MIFDQLKHALQSENRQINIDVLRGMAVLSVVLFHFNGLLPYGYIGVDLFFVISGYLVGGALMRDFLNGKKIRFFSFILKRGFKIWPSYYVFILIAFLISNSAFSDSFSAERMQFSELPRYLFWYRNFTGLPFHFSTAHIWSLCIEEHFYVLLPILMLLLGFFKLNKNYLIGALLLIIMAAFGSKLFMYFMTNSKDTYSMTFNRLDTFSWGILVAYLHYSGIILADKLFLRRILLVLSLVGVALILYLEAFKLIPLFKELIMHSILPLFMALLIWTSLAETKQKWMTPFRVVGYYSYNWYLWNPLIGMLCFDHLGFGIFSFAFYFLGSFFIAVLGTHFIEEPFLNLRKRYLNN